jgi:hypothetical protein
MKNASLYATGLIAKCEKRGPEGRKNNRGRQQESFEVSE